MLPKEFIIEDGQIYYRKKPLYKQALFWTTLVGGAFTIILGLVSIILMFALAGTDTLEKLSVDDFGSYDMPVDLKQYHEASLGEKVDLEGEFSLTVQSMELDSSISPISQDFDKAFLVTVTIENHSDKDFYFDELAFGLSDSSGEIPYYLDLRTYDVNIIEKVEPGKTEEVRLVFAVDEEASYALTFSDFVWYNHQGKRL